jgi:hypothetical protein
MARELMQRIKSALQRLLARCKSLALDQLYHLLTKELGG